MIYPLAFREKHEDLNRKINVAVQRVRTVLNIVDGTPLVRIAAQRCPNLEPLITENVHIEHRRGHPTCGVAPTMPYCAAAVLPV